MPPKAWPYPAPVDDGAARHLTPGLSLPQLPLRATTGGTVDLVTMPGGTIVFIYPWTGKPGLPNPPGWDDIPGAHGSTPEAQGFRDLHDQFVAKRFQVFGLSGQSTEDQQEFAARIALPFPLLSDAEGRLRDALALPTFETGGIAYLKRLTFIVCDGTIRRTLYPVHPPHTHATEVLALV